MACGPTTNTNTNHLTSSAHAPPFTSTQTNQSTSTNQSVTSNHVQVTCKSRAESGAKTKKLMTPWLIDQINCGQIPGLVWIDEEAKIFQLPWKHFGKPGVSKEVDGILFQRWAEYKDHYQQGDNASRWKTNFRSALKNLKNVKQLKDEDRSVEEPFRVYQFVEKKLNLSPSLSPSCSEEEECSPSAISCTSEDDDLFDFELASSFDDDDMSFIDDFLDESSNLSPGAASDSIISHIDNLLHTFQSLAVIPNAEPHELSSIKVKLYYADKEVCMQIITNPCGVRIAHQPVPHLPPNVVVENSQQLYVMYGPLQAEQMCFPSNDDVVISKILEYIGRGLVLQCQNGQIRATRLSQARVYHSDSSGISQDKLPREETVTLFDFTNDFYPKFQLFEAGEGPLPSYERYFCFMESWSKDSPLESKRVRATVTHCFAEKMFQQYQNRKGEYFCSGPNEKDTVAKQLENIMLQES